MAEDRFKNLSPLQWLVHYHEINKFKKAEINKDRAVLDLLLDRIEMLWFTTNPKIGKQLLEMKERSKINKETKVDEVTPDNFKDKWQDIKKLFPKTLDTKELFPEHDKRFVTPKFKRSELKRSDLGIHIEE